MRYLKLLSGLLLLVSIIGCSSKSTTPVQPEIVVMPSTNESVTEDNNHILSGIWKAEIDFETLECEVAPDRSSMVHYNVSGGIPFPQIQVNAIHPNGEIDLDVTLQNTYPIDVYDVRLIIYTNDSTDSFLDPEDWTPLYDIPGGLDINPFRAYSKSEPRRIFAKYSQQTENLRIFLEPGHTWLAFAVDASFPSNCNEPVGIVNFTQGALGNSVGAFTTAEIDVYDWQNDVSEVTLECPEITGQPSVSFSQISSISWQLNLVNDTGAPEGEYTGYIKALSADSGTLALYDQVKITVTGVLDIVITWNGQERNASVESIEIDSSGNIYCLASLNLDTQILSKLDPGLQVIWSTPLHDVVGGVSNPDLALSESGFVYIIGSFRGTVDFDPGPGENRRSSGWCGRYETYYTSDIFVSKFDTDGNYIWTSTKGTSCCEGSSGSTGNEYGRAIDVDNYGDPYITGVTSDSGSDRGRPLFCKMSQIDGATLWWNSVSTDGSGYSVVHDGDGKVSFAGTFRGSVDFDPGPGTDIHEANGYSDYFLTQYDSDGQFRWAHTWGGSSGDNPSNLTIDESDNIYSSGPFYLNIDLNPGPTVEWYEFSGYFLSKFNSAGDYLWGKAWGGDGNVWNNNYGITSSSDSIFVMGSFRGVDFDFDPGPGIELHSTVGIYNDMFISRFNSSGDMMQATVWHGPDADEEPMDLACNSDGEVIAVGAFEGTLDFDPGPDEHIITTDEWQDAFLMKLAP